MELTLFALIGMDIDASPLYWFVLSIATIIKTIKTVGQIRSLPKPAEGD